MNLKPLVALETAVFTRRNRTSPKKMDGGIGGCISFRDAFDWEAFFSGRPQRLETSRK
jgi:hypothetical protein